MQQDSNAQSVLLSRVPVRGRSRTFQQVAWIGLELGSSKGRSVKWEPCLNVCRSSFRLRFAFLRWSLLCAHPRFRWSSFLIISAPSSIGPTPAPLLTSKTLHLNHRRTSLQPSHVPATSRHPLSSPGILLFKRKLLCSSSFSPSDPPLRLLWVWIGNHLLRREPSVAG